MALIEIRNVTKKYGENTVLNGVSLTIEKGDFITIVGPSGCGKTTLLKMINGLIPFDNGEIMIDGKLQKDWDDIVLKRSIGYVIQQIGLFPHLTISENISYVLMLQGLPVEKRNQRAGELISMIGLDPSYLTRYPGELSGGQRQRIGVARALAADPQIILMDEPFGAVDEIVRKILQDELQLLHQSLQKTILFVTHDIDEAIKLGTKIVVMNHGCIEQADSKKQVVFFPANEFVRDFFGLKNFTSYLNQVDVKDVMVSGTCDCSYSIYEDMNVLEAVKMLFDYGITEIMVKNRHEENTGIFRFDVVKEKIIK